MNKTSKKIEKWIGKEGEAGTILGQAPYRKTGHAIARFGCRHCNREAESRLYYLLNGRTKSCNCLEKKKFSEHYQFKVKQMPREQRLALYDRVQTTGLGGMEGNTRYCASFAHRSVKRQIENLPPAMKRRIYSQAQRGIPMAVQAKHYNVPISWILAVICSLHQIIELDTEHRNAVREVNQKISQLMGQASWLISNPEQPPSKEQANELRVNLQMALARKDFSPAVPGSE